MTLEEIKELTKVSFAREQVRYGTQFDKLVDSIDEEILGRAEMGYDNFIVCLSNYHQFFPKLEPKVVRDLRDYYYVRGYNTVESGSMRYEVFEINWKEEAKC